MIQKISDVEHPEVGKFYIVPMVKRHARFPRRVDDLLPIIGPWHEDADIGVSIHHFHYDVRFLTDAQLDGINPAHYLGRVHASHTSTGNSPTGGIASTIPPEIQYRRRRMRREMPDFPMSGTFRHFLEACFRNHVLQNCKTCPHRGMPLTGLRQDEQGRVICNGHGLRWNLTTGRLSPRTDE